MGSVLVVGCPVPLALPSCLDKSMLDVGCVEPQTSEVGSRPRSRLARASKMAIERRGGREWAPESEPCRWASAMRLFVSSGWCHGY
jgi:hypothetical protein